MKFEEIVILLLLIIIIVFIAYLIISVKNKIIERKKINALENNATEMTPYQFLYIRNQSVSGRGKLHQSSKYNLPGVYILFNMTRNMYYVGQGQKVFDRINNHFTGKGNGDVYADYKYGNQFTIKIIYLKTSGFKTLNELEKAAISKYNSYYAGYNKTRGNK